jgi:hypothetical protein
MIKALEKELKKMNHCPLNVEPGLFGNAWRVRERLPEEKVYHKLLLPTNAEVRSFEIRIRLLNF